MNAKGLMIVAAAAALLGCAQDSSDGTTAAETSPTAGVPNAAADSTAAAPAVASDSSSATASLPEIITAQKGGFVPEGVEYDKTKNRFLVGSLAEGTIFQIDAGGQMTPVIQDADLVSTAGLEVVEAADRIYVANADESMFDGSSAGQAKLGVYELSTGKRLAMVDLAAAAQDAPADAKHFANDVAVDSAGNAYVTDTPFKVIFAVSADYKPSVLYRFGADQGGPNGIVFEPSGYLIATSGPNLVKIPLDNPQGATQVKLAEPIPGADGMVWLPNGSLAVVGKGGVVALKSDDAWASATVVGKAPFEGQASTAAAVGDEIYVVKPHFNDQVPPTIEHVSFN